MKPRDSWIVAMVGTAVLLAAVIGFFSDLGGAVATWQGWVQALNARLGLGPESFLTRLEVPLFLLCVLMLALLLVAVQRLARRAGSDREPGSPVSAAEERIRSQYLAWFRDEVENRWRASIHHAHFVDIGLDETADMTTPWTFVYQEPAAAPRVFSSVDQAFALFDGRLLLLGAPGSGKSTTLLHIARRLLGTAETDPQAPMPVLLNLSSFRWTRQSRRALRALHGAGEASAEEVLFEHWVVGQLRELRRVRGLAAVAERWIQEGKIAFLLDGLDEVDEEMLPQVAQALNATLRYAGPPAVVCSRIIEYQKLREDLRQGLFLKGAVTLQPLAPAQIDAYLEKAKATGLREALAGDADLGELARTPLTLSMMVLAYGGLAPTEIPANLSLLDRRHHLFDSYIVRMMQRQARRRAGKPFDPLLRETEKTPYSEESIHRWLGWLAVRLSARMQTAFIPSRLADSLGAGAGSFDELFSPANRHGWAERFGARLLATFALSTALAAGLALGAGAGPWGFLAAALGGPALAFSSFRVGDESRFWTWIGVAGTSALVLAIHLAITQSLAVLLPALPSPALGLVGLMLPVLVLIYLSGELGPNKTKLIGHAVVLVLLALGAMALVGRLDLAVWAVPLGAALAFSRWIAAASQNWPILLLTILGFGGGMALGAAYGRWLESLPAVLPALLVTALFWLSHLADVAFLAAGFAAWAIAGLIVAGPAGAVLGSLAGFALLKWSEKLFDPIAELLDRWLLEPCLRLFLIARGALPLRFRRLVDYAVETMLLKRAGEGFEFIHRLLRDHFATRRLTLRLRDERGAIRLDVLDQLSRQGESSLDALGQLARHPDPAVRAAAVTGLGRLATPRVIPVLSDLFAHEPEPAVRAALIAGLGEQPGVQTVELITVAQNDPSPAVRKAIVGIGGRRSRLERWWLVSALSDPDREVVREAVLCLAGRPMPKEDLSELLSHSARARLGEHLLSLLEENEPEVRVVAVRLLAEMRNRRSIPGLLRTSGDASPAVRCAALEALGRLGWAAELPALCAALRDKDAMVRAAAARSLAQLRTAIAQSPPEIQAQAEQGLLGALGDRSPSVRAAAATALADFPCENAPAALLGALLDRSRSVRTAAADALARSAAPEVLDQLLAWLTRGSLRHRSAAALALGVLRAPEAVPGLVELFESPPLQVGRSLGRWLGWTTADVRWEAIEALKRIGNPAAAAKLREIETTGPTSFREAVRRRR